MVSNGTRTVLPETVLEAKLRGSDELDTIESSLNLMFDPVEALRFIYNTMEPLIVARENERDPQMQADKEQKLAEAVIASRGAFSLAITELEQLHRNAHNAFEAIQQRRFQG